MIYKQGVLVFVLAVFLFAPAALHADDVDDLKATFEQLVKAINSRDPDTFVALAHEGVVSYSPISPFPVVGKAASRQGVETLFNNNESLTITPINPQFSVVDNTGIVWGHFATAFKPKDGPMDISFLRCTFTFVKSEGKWLRVSHHLSAVPSGN